MNKLSKYLLKIIGKEQQFHKNYLQSLTHPSKHDLMTRRRNNNFWTLGEKYLDIQCNLNQEVTNDLKDILLDKTILSVQQQQVIYSFICQKNFDIQVYTSKVLDSYLVEVQKLALRQQEDKRNEEQQESKQKEQEEEQKEEQYESKKTQVEQQQNNKKQEQEQQIVIGGLLYKIGLGWLVQLLVKGLEEWANDNLLDPQLYHLEQAKTFSQTLDLMFILNIFNNYIQHTHVDVQPLIYASYKNVTQFNANTHLNTLKSSLIFKYQQYLDNIQ